MRNVLDFLDIVSSLGKIDMVWSDKNGISSCVFKNKAGTSAPRTKLPKYETQLAAYMVATAIENKKTMEIISKNKHEVQNLIVV